MTRLMRPILADIPDVGIAEASLPSVESTSEVKDSYTVLVHNEGAGQRLWAEVEELPECFASGWDMGELREALAEAISLYLSEPGREVHVELDEEPGVTEVRLLAR